MTNKQLGARIRQARLKRGWNQEGLGRKLPQPVTYSTISDIERGRYTIAWSRLVDIANALGQPVGYFVGEAA